MVPLSAATVAVLEEWSTQRGVCRPLPHPRTGALTDILFVAHGRRLGQTRLRNGLLAAVERSGLRDAGGKPLIVTPNQLRHPWATELANAGRSLQALMALLGHVTPQMTLRYATLASPTLRDAYDQAMGKVCRRFTLTPVGKPIIPDTVSWLGSEMLKTHVAHGYCSRHEAAGAPAPTPTSAKPATTSSPDPSSAARSRRNAGEWGRGRGVAVRGSNLVSTVDSSPVPSRLSSTTNSSSRESICGTGETAVYALSRTRDSVLSDEERADGTLIMPCASHIGDRTRLVLTEQHHATGINHWCRPHQLTASSSARTE
nr:tyrosine-type recombinase/integrase [Rhodococcus opacus]